MRAPVRLFLSLLIGLFLEVAFVELTLLALKRPKREVKNVIKISLVRKVEEVHRIRVEREKGKERKEKTELRRTPTPKVESREPSKKIEKGTKRREERRGGGLKPLQGNLPETYLEGVKEAIEEQIFYPLEAIERGIEGEVTVQFTLNRSGRALECKPLSGDKILSEATCIAIKSAKFPPIPDEIKNDKLQFQLQIDYSLKRAFR